MAYDSGFLPNRIDVLNRQASTSDDFALTKGNDYSLAATIWANVSFARGVKPMREGSVLAYSIRMVRCRPNAHLTRESRLRWHGTVYQITSFNQDDADNTVQMTCQELPK